MPDFISPPQYVQVNGQVCPVFTASLSASVSNNQTVISGIPASGSIPAKILRIVGFHNYGGGGVSDYTLKEETSGTTKWLGILHTTQDLGEFYEAGYYELATGKGLLADVRTTAMYFNIQYIAYTA